MVHSPGPITSGGSTAYDEKQLAIGLPDKNPTRLSNDGRCRSLPNPNLNPTSRSHRFDEIAIVRAVHTAIAQPRTGLLPARVPFVIGPDGHGGNRLDQISIDFVRGPRFSAIRFLRRPRRMLDLDHAHGAAETLSFCESDLRCKMYRTKLFRHEPDQLKFVHDVGEGFVAAEVDRFGIDGAARSLHSSGLRTRRESRRDQQSCHHAGARRRLSGRRHCNGKGTRPDCRRARPRSRRSDRPFDLNGEAKMPRKKLSSAIIVR